VIPHPLTLLYCWLLGMGLSEALGYVLLFVSQLCDDAARAGLPAGLYSGALFVIGGISVFAAGFFIGAAMRLLAEKDWRKAAGWAALSLLIAHIRNPGILLFGLPGCFLGAWLCGRHRHDERLEGAEGFLRSWMFWERGGAF
jgi:hypothetical protein